MTLEEAIHAAMLAHHDGKGVHAAISLVAKVAAQVERNPHEIGTRAGLECAEGTLTANRDRLRREVEETKRESS